MKAVDVTVVIGTLILVSDASLNQEGRRLSQDIR